MHFNISYLLAFVAIAFAGPGDISYDYEIDQMTKVNDALTDLEAAITSFVHLSSAWPAVLRDSTSVVRVVVSAAMLPTGEKPADPPTEAKQQEAFAVAEKLASTVKSTIDAVVAAKPKVNQIPFGSTAIAKMFDGLIHGAKVFSGILIDNTMPDKKDRAQKISSDVEEDLKRGKAAFQ